MNAMSDDSPKPTKPWEFPDDSTLKVRNTIPTMLIIGSWREASSYGSTRW